MADGDINYSVSVHASSVAGLLSLYFRRWCYGI